MAPPAKKHKGPSAYMIFAEEQRPGLLVKLRAESADGKVPVTIVAKALGELWKSLPETEQQSYRDKAQQRAVESAAAAEETAAEQEGVEQDAGAEAPAAQAPAALPKHLVKKIMLADDEVQRVSADAQWLVAEAAALFLQQLAVKASAAAAAKKRKTIQLADFEHVVRCDKRLVEAGLKDIIQNKHFFELHGITNASKAAGNNSKQQTGKAAAGLKGIAAKSKPQQAGTDENKENQQQQGQDEEQAIGGDEQQEENAEEEEDVEGEQLTDEQRIELQEQNRKRVEAMAKARAAKAAEKKIAKEREAAKGYHKISTFFASNKPDAFV